MPAGSPTLRGKLACTAGSMAASAALASAVPALATAAPRDGGALNPAITPSTADVESAVRTNGLASTAAASNSGCSAQPGAIWIADCIRSSSALCSSGTSPRATMTASDRSAAGSSSLGSPGAAYCSPSTMSWSWSRYSSIDARVASSAALGGPAYAPGWTIPRVWIAAGAGSLCRARDVPNEATGTATAVAAATASVRRQRCPVGRVRSIGAELVRSFTSSPSGRPSGTGCTPVCIGRLRRRRRRRRVRIRLDRRR